MWTKFWDMHSGGRTKVEPYNKIYIEAPQKVAEIVFYNKFGRNPHRVTCTCCGEDYSVDDHESLAHLTGYHRNCAWDDEVHGYVEEPDRRYDSQRKLISLEEYCALEDVLIIRADEITDDEKIGYLPQEGYVWV